MFKKPKAPDTRPDKANLSIYSSHLNPIHLNETEILADNTSKGTNFIQENK